MTYLNSMPIEMLTINELRERNDWSDAQPAQCQDCGGPMPDNSRQVHLDCETYRLEHYAQMAEDSMNDECECGGDLDVDGMCGSCDAGHDDDCDCFDCFERAVGRAESWAEGER